MLIRHPDFRVCHHVKEKGKTVGPQADLLHRVVGALKDAGFVIDVLACGNMTFRVRAWLPRAHEHAATFSVFSVRARFWALTQRAELPRAQG